MTRHRSMLKDKLIRRSEVTRRVWKRDHRNYSRLFKSNEQRRLQQTESEQTVRLS